MDNGSISEWDGYVNVAKVPGPVLYGQIIPQ